MAQPIKLLGDSITVTTANTVSNSQAVFITVGATATTITQTLANSATRSIVIPAGGTIVISKAPTDTIAANAAVSATPIARG